MASTAVSSGGWSAPSPYLGPDANTQGGSAPVGADGNIVQMPANDVGAQLGYALSAYHTHQTANNPYTGPVNSQGYGAQAATANNEALGAAMQASAPSAAASYAAATGYNRLGIATGPGLSPTTASAPSAANGGVNTVTAPATQSPYIYYVGADGRGQIAQYNATTGQYVLVNDPKATITGSTNGAGTLHLGDGTTSAFNNLSGQGETFSLNAYNTQLAQAAQAAAAQKAGLAQGSQAATTAVQNANTSASATAPSVNNNQDFINQLSGQLGNINSAPGVQAADTTSANTQAALNSQLSTSAYQSGDLGAAARYGAGAAVGAEGAGALSHEQAAANAYDATFAQLGQAASQRLSVADAETQQQASADVQSIADEVSSLQSQLGQLDTTTANQVAQHLAALQDQISAYQNGVANYTGTAQESAATFKGILSAAAQVGAIVAAAG